MRFEKKVNRGWLFSFIFLEIIKGFMVMWSNKFNKIKEVVKEILEKSIKEDTTIEILDKDIKVIVSYIRFSIEKRVESLILGLNKSSEDNLYEIEMDHNDLFDLRRSLKTVFSDMSYDLFEKYKDGEEWIQKGCIVNNFRDEVESIMIKALNKLSPIYLVKKEKKEEESTLLKMKKFG